MPIHTLCGILILSLIVIVVPGLGKVTPDRMLMKLILFDTVQISKFLNSYKVLLNFKSDQENSIDHFY